MRNSCASWKSRSVSSGMRRSSSQRGARSRSTGSSSSALPHSSAYAGGAFVPVKDLFSSPHQDAGPRGDVLAEPFQVADAMGHAGDEQILDWRSEEHTSELQSRPDLVCRLLLEKKK